MIFFGCNSNTQISILAYLVNCYSWLDGLKSVYISPVYRTSRGNTQGSVVLNKADITLLQAFPVTRSPHFLSL